MKPFESAAVYQRDLEALQLDPLAPDPWGAWKAFKAFLRRETEGVHDAASFQYSVFPSENGALEATVYWVRQFTTRDPHDGEDVLFGRFIVEFHYTANALPLYEDAEVWTQDFSTLEEWASVVEGLPQFQDAMNRQPTQTLFDYDED